MLTSMARLPLQTLPAFRAVARTALAAAAHGPMARAAPGDRHRAVDLAAPGRAAARGLPCRAAPGRRSMEGPAGRVPDGLSHHRARLASGSASPAGLRCEGA